MMAPFCTRTPPLRAAVGKGGGGVGSKRGVMMAPFCTRTPPERNCK